MVNYFWSLNAAYIGANRTQTEKLLEILQPY